MWQSLKVVRFITGKGLKRNKLTDNEELYTKGVIAKKPG